MPPPSNVTRTGISLLLRVSISFLLLPPVLSPLSSSSLSWVTTSGTTGCESIFTRPEIDRPTEQLPEQPRAHEAATLSRSDPLWKKVCFRPYTWPFARRVSLPLRRRAMAAGNNRERSKRKRLRTTSLRSPLFFSFFFFPLRFTMTLIVIDGLMGYPCINEFLPSIFLQRNLFFFFNAIFVSVFRNIYVLEKHKSILNIL